jgi:SAGA-associated factor 73
VQSEQFPVDHCHTTCSSPPTKRRTKPSSKVRTSNQPSCPPIISQSPQSTPSNKSTEAAIDANAPLEDEDDANAGPIDSDEETALVMSALSKWNPQPVVPQPVLIPIKLKYQLARLREQLDNATSGGTVNIFKVASKNGEPFPVRDLAGDEDAPGERDESYGVGMAGGAAQPGVQGVRRQSGFAAGQTPVRRAGSISGNR